jgi:hypothetical protein
MSVATGERERVSDLARGQICLFCCLGISIFTSEYLCKTGLGLFILIILSLQFAPRLQSNPDTQPDIGNSHPTILISIFCHLPSMVEENSKILGMVWFGLVGLHGKVPLYPYFHVCLVKPEMTSSTMVN